jgi:hypothetical protein
MYEAGIDMQPIHINIDTLPDFIIRKYMCVFFAVFIPKTQL